MSTNQQFKFGESVIIKNPANIKGTFTGIIFEVLGDDNYTVAFLYNGISTSTSIHSSQLTAFGDAKFVVVE